MVYIYQKKIGEKKYYYLRISERKGEKIVVRDLAYLGNSIERVKKALDSLSQYKQEIRKAHRTINLFLESNYYTDKIKKLKLKKDEFLEEKLIDVESCKFHYNEIFKKLNSLTQEDILKNFVIEFAFNTAAIEGNTITLKEARNLIEEGFTPKNKTLREIYDIQNTQKTFFEILKLKKPITSEFIISIHRKLMENIDSRIGFRTSDVRVIKSRFKASPAKYVKIDIEILIKWYNENKKQFHPLVLGALFHHKFEKIHPFFDGNGRTGRMLMNYILIREEYPPVIFKKKLRTFYLDALGKADKTDLTSCDKNAYKELINFSADSLVKGYWDIFLV